MTDQKPGLLDAAVAAPARLCGAVLAGAVRAIALVRPDAKPLHPRGRYLRATLTRFGTSTTGVRWIDSPGTDQIVVRMSRAVGLTESLPDVHGIAIRLQVDGQDADLLFATTGLGRITRFVLTAATEPDRRPYTTLLPYRTPRGPVVLGIEFEDDRSFRLLHAYGSGRWTAFGRVTLAGPYDGPAIAFDPVRAAVPGLPPYAWVSALRLPAYRAAQDRSR